MLTIQKRSSNLRHWLVGATVGLLLVAVAGVVYWGLFQPFSPQGTANLPVASPLKVETKNVTSRLLVMGDVFWGRYVHDWSMASSQRYAYPFARLDEFQRSNYDAWVANMECPITNNPKVSSRVEDSTLTFDCSPAYLTEAKKWFTAVSLANNHTDNQGATGFAETKQHLSENGIQYFGSYNPEDVDNLCDVVSVPAHVKLSNETTKEGKLPLVWCGYQGVFRTPSATSVAVIGRYKRFNVVVMPHSGSEYKSAPDEIKTTLYRSLIDAGADVVLGNHPHWVQTTEAYKGKLIVYSMGNFIFDQQGATEVTRSAVVSLSLSVDQTAAPDLDKWLALGETCATYNDNCVQQAASENLTKLPLQYHFSILGSSDSGKQTHRATDAELASIKQRLNWSQTVTKLTGVYSGE